MCKWDVQTRPLEQSTDQFRSNNSETLVANCAFYNSWLRTIPTMDTQYETLKALVDTLSLKSNLLGWNMYQNKSGVIMVKIRFGEHSNNKENGQHDVQSEENFIQRGNRNRSENQIKRNFLRAKSWKEQLGSKRKRYESSPELPRNDSHSETIPEPVSDLTRCEVDSQCLTDASDHGDISESPMPAQEACLTDLEISPISDNQPCIQSITNNSKYINTPDIEPIDQNNGNCEFEDNVSVCSSVEPETPRWKRADPKCWERRCDYDNDYGHLSEKDYNRSRAQGKPTLVDMVKQFQYGRSLRWCEKCETSGQPFLMCRTCHEVHKRHDRHKDFIKIPIGCQNRFWDEQEFGYCYSNL